MLDESARKLLPHCQTIEAAQLNENADILELAKRVQKKSGAIDCSRSFDLLAASRLSSQELQITGRVEGFRVVRELATNVHKLDAGFLGKG